MKINLTHAVRLIEQGGLIAYPTETVYGLGCDANNLSAIERLLRVKNRAASKGLIVLINNYQQLSQLALPLSEAHLQQLKEKWPGPTTFLLPCLPAISSLLRGDHPSIAVRMTSHPIASRLCQKQPIVSTSANPQGLAVATNYTTLVHYFDKKIDGILAMPNTVSGPPSQLIDIKSGKRLR